jgi:beta-galactosidase
VIAYREQGGGFHVISTVVGQGDSDSLPAPILHGLLTNLGAVSAAPSLSTPDTRTQGTFHTVDLRSHCNMGFRDEQENDRKGGFSDQGNRDLRDLPTGRQVFRGVPFDIIAPGSNNGRSCLNLGFESKATTYLNWLPRRIEGIRVGRKAKAVYFLHVSSWTAGGQQGHYLVRYPRVTEHTVKVPVIPGRNIADWSVRADLPDAQVAWAGVSNLGTPVCVYMFRWENPTPSYPIESIDFVSNFTSSLGLIAITLEE